MAVKTLVLVHELTLTKINNESQAPSFLYISVVGEGRCFIMEIATNEA